MTQDVDVESDSVIRVVIQYLTENNLHRSAQMLQDETGICLNSLEDPSSFQSDVINGRWDAVIQKLSYLSLPEDHTRDVYEQVYLELLDHGTEPDTLATFLDLAAPLNVDGLRRHRLKQLPASYRLDEAEKNAKRNKLASDLDGLIQTSQSGQLVSIISDALRYRFSKPPIGRLDLLSGELKPYEDTVSKVVYSRRFAKGSFVEKAVYSTDGSLLALGCNDGLIEVVETKSGSFQNVQLNVADASVTALAFGTAVLVCGDLNGVIYVWNLSTGKMMFRQATHSGPVNSLQVKEDMILSCSRRCIITSITKRGNIKEFEACGNDACFIGDKLIGCADGRTVKIFDWATGLLVNRIVPPVPRGVNVEQTRSIKKVVSMYKDRLLVVCQAPFAVNLSLSSESDVTFYRSEGDLNSAVMKSSRIYATSEDGGVHCFGIDKELPFKSFHPNGPSAIPTDSLASHPIKNQVVIAYRDGSFYVLS